MHTKSLCDTGASSEEGAEADDEDDDEGAEEEEEEEEEDAMDEDGARGDASPSVAAKKGGKSPGSPQKRSTSLCLPKQNLHLSGTKLWEPQLL